MLLRYTKTIRKRRYTTYLLVFLYFVISYTGNVLIHSESAVLHWLSIPLWVIFLVGLFKNKVVDRYEREEFALKENAGYLIAYRNADEVFSLDIGNVNKLYYERSLFVRKILVIQLKNYNEHTFKLPIFCKVSGNGISVFADRIGSFV